uniref:CBM20 domain-containing protein n=1 Tax=Ceratitis capitata TaxID=7213 RepID=W8BKM9_CERCA
MQRWFFADEAEDCDAMAAPPSSTSSLEVYQPGTPVHVNWKFWVLVNRDMAPNERLAIVGSTEQLGNWQFSNCIIMTKEDGEWALVPAPNGGTLTTLFYIF